MAKFHGKIGYSLPVETSEGVWTSQVTEKIYTGDLIRQTNRFDRGEGVTSDIKMDHRLSILADSFSSVNIGYMRYVILNNQAWAITSAEVNYPRIILNVGGLYNGPTS